MKLDTSRVGDDVVGSRVGASVRGFVGDVMEDDVGRSVGTLVGEFVGDVVRDDCSGNS